MPAAALAGTAGLFAYEFIEGSRATVTGKVRKFELFVPKQTPGLSGPPYPVVVLLHGFMRRARHMRRNAQYLASRGMVVFVPEMDWILWGHEKRGRNIDEVIDHVAWLLPRAADAGDRLYGAFDARRLGVVGHSSGGPISLEAIIGMQQRGIAVDSVCLLDGIVWPRTMARIPQLKPLDVFSVRSESAICNQHASVLRLLDSLSFPYRDLKVNNSKHCDPENPTDFGCMCICGPSHDAYRETFLRVMYVYFKDRLGAPRVDGSHLSLDETIRQMEKASKVTRGKGLILQADSERKPGADVPL